MDALVTLWDVVEVTSFALNLLVSQGIDLGRECFKEGFAVHFEKGFVSRVSLWRSLWAYALASRRFFPVVVGRYPMTSVVTALRRQSLSS